MGAVAAGVVSAVVVLAAVSAAVVLTAVAEDQFQPSIVSLLLWSGGDR